MEIDVKSLHKGMLKSGYICTPKFATQVAAGLSSKPTRGVMLHGPAGVGKSYLPEVIAKILKVEMFWHQVSPGTYETDLLLKMYPSEKTKAGMTLEESTIYQAAIASQKKVVLLVLDEWDKSRPSADGYFLDFFQSGRLPLPPRDGKKVKANLDNLLVMLTSNDERPFSEPFLRRFSKIDMELLHPTLVRDALLKTHPDNKYLPNALALYARSLISEMHKPVTIQELRQLLDAIEFTGKFADWDTLVRQFITKTEENHILLKDAEGQPLDREFNRTRTRVNPSSYGGFAVDSIKDSVTKTKIELPPLVSGTEWLGESDVYSFSEVDSSCGLIEKNDATYSIFSYIGTPTENSSNLEWIKSCRYDEENVVLALKTPIELDRLLVRHDGRGAEGGALSLIEPMVEYPGDVRGEIMLVSPMVQRGEFLRMAKHNNHIIKSMTINEVVTRAVYNVRFDSTQDRIDMSINFRWTKSHGLQIICPIGLIYKLRSGFSTGESSSILRNGLRNSTDICNAYHFFSERQSVPVMNLRALRYYEDVAEYGVMRLSIAAPNESDRWNYVAKAISDAKGGDSYSTNQLRPHKHEFFRTDWVTDGNITVGAYTDMRGYSFMEFRFHGGLSSTMIEHLYNAGVRGLVNYVPVYSSSKVVNTALSKKGWTRSTHWSSTLSFQKRNGNLTASFYYTGLNTMGFFWCRIRNDGAGSKRSCNELLRLKNLHEDHYS